LAYVFDPINNTLIDDEDKSLGNKLALNDDEFQKLLDIPGVFRASEAPQPPPKQEVLDREAINRFIRDNRAEGGRINFDNGSDNPFIDIEDLNKKLQKANINRKTESIDFYINKFGKETLDKIAQDKHGKNFSELEGDNLNNLKRRLDKYENFVKQNNRMPTESEARKFGRIDRDKTITGTGTKEITEEDIRNKLIKNNKPAETFKKKIIFADKNIQNEFEAELTKRYSFPRTSAAAEAAGVLNNQQIYEKFLKPAGYKPESTRTIVNDYKKFLDVDFQELTTEQKEAKKVERDKLEKISQGGKRISGTVDNPAHHMFPLGDQIGAKAGEFTVIPKSINGKIAYANKQMKKLVLERGKILDKVKIDQTVNIKDLDKQLADINNKAEEVIKNHYKKYPSHEGLLNWKKIDFVLDDVGRLLNVNQVGTIGGDYKKWTLANIDKTILDKKVANLSKEELADFRKIIEETSVARDAGDKGFGAKDSTPIKNLFTSLKNKLDTSRMFTSRIPGGAIALTPLDFILSYGSGMPLLESAASAGSYLLKDPLIGKTVNIPLAIAQDMQDPESMMERAGQRKEKFKNVLEDITGLDQDDPLYDQLKEKFSNMEAGDQPNIDPFQAAKGGRAKLNRGGGVEITPLPRSNFGNGGAAGADVDFATELEYFFTNPDAELPAMQTYKETNNPIKVLNDIINPRNYPYYADVLARAGIRIGEFGARLLPATGKLISDLIQKPAFKVKSTEDNYVRDYLDPPPPSNIKGTGIFSEFLENITPTTLEKKVGLDTLIKKEEQRLKDTGSTVGPKVFADTLGLGTEVAAPIFPGLKLLRAYAKKNNLPVNDVTQKLLVKEIDQVLDKQGMDRREFLQVTGAGATVILAKMLGFGDEIARTAKVAEKVAEKATSGGVPPYFFQLVEKIKRSGQRLEPEFDARVENNMQFENFVMKENMATGEISIQRTTEGGFNTGDDVIEGTISDELITYKPGETVLGKDGKYYRTADEYEEVTAKPDEEGKMKDIEPGLDSIEEIIELLPNKLKMSELEDAGYNIDAFPDNIKQLLIDDLQKTN
jgi:hypothetical protein